MDHHSSNMVHSRVTCSSSSNDDKNNKSDHVNHNENNDDSIIAVATTDSTRSSRTTTTPAIESTLHHFVAPSSFESLHNHKNNFGRTNPKTTLTSTRTVTRNTTPSMRTLPNYIDFDIAVVAHKYQSPSEKKSTSIPTSTTSTAIVQPPMLLLPASIPTAPPTTVITPEGTPPSAPLRPSSFSYQHHHRHHHHIHGSAYLNFFREQVKQIQCTERDGAQVRGGGASTPIMTLPTLSSLRERTSTAETDADGSTVSPTTSPGPMRTITTHGMAQPPQQRRHLRKRPHRRTTTQFAKYVHLISTKWKTLTIEEQMKYDSDSLISSTQAMVSTTAMVPSLFRKEQDTQPQPQPSTAEQHSQPDANQCLTETTTKITSRTRGRSSRPPPPPATTVTTTTTTMIVPPSPPTTAEIAPLRRKRTKVTTAAITNVPITTKQQQLSSSTTSKVSSSNPSLRELLRIRKYQHSSLPNLQQQRLTHPPNKATIRNHNVPTNNNDV